MFAARTVPEETVIVDAGVSETAPDMTAFTGAEHQRRNGKPVHGAVFPVGVIPVKIIVSGGLVRRLRIPGHGLSSVAE